MLPRRPGGACRLLVLALLALLASHHHDGGVRAAAPPAAGGRAAMRERHGAAGPPQPNAEASIVVAARQPLFDYAVAVGLAVLNATLQRAGALPDVRTTVEVPLIGGIDVAISGGARRCVASVVLGGGLCPLLLAARACAECSDRSPTPPPTRHPQPCLSQRNSQRHGAGRRPVAHARRDRGGLLPRHSGQRHRQRVWCKGGGGKGKQWAGGQEWPAMGSTAAGSHLTK